MPHFVLLQKKCRKMLSQHQRSKGALSNEESASRTRRRRSYRCTPQIDVPLRIFVVSTKVLPKEGADLAFINPTFIRFGKKKELMSEGCLSVRWKYGMVKRATTVTVKAYNEQGNEFVMSARGLLAQIFQHEIDHLNGILFIDSATNIEDIPPEHGVH